MSSLVSMVPVASVSASLTSTKPPVLPVAEATERKSPESDPALPAPPPTPENRPLPPDVRSTMTRWVPEPEVPVKLTPSKTNRWPSPFSVVLIVVPPSCGLRSTVRVSSMKTPDRVNSVELGVLATK